MCLFVYLYSGPCNLIVLFLVNSLWVGYMHSESSVFTLLKVISHTRWVRDHVLVHHRGPED